jgi:hypothetical protein
LATLSRAWGLAIAATHATARAVAILWRTCAKAAPGVIGGLAIALQGNAAIVSSVIATVVADIATTGAGIAPISTAVTTSIPARRSLAATSTATIGTPAT